MKRFELLRRFSRPTPFPGEPLRPAWVHLQIARIINPIDSCYSILLAGNLNPSLVKRRGWDSNPCALADKRFSRPPRYDHFDTSPNGLVQSCLSNKQVILYHHVKNSSSRIFIFLSTTLSTIYTQSMCIRREMPGFSLSSQILCLLSDN